ncbi:hypothetical protein GCM10011504_24940 [Siccirubricoccus deserti]|uniref:Uncharacterized protein n=1 Tax=Siccirubricoccus deserti TaxID=2013562 RepID=A0A9X0QYG2_9PROT|nr:hypothetical protein [Siccirubricoccus deserti]MBC4015900.1 hypothetical protein [Siccirubricoccus deserti]GGC45477.1 hypothetical protein GCM10011504_24940 [Siccirubricoccus deserti]
METACQAEMSHMETVKYINVLAHQGELLLDELEKCEPSSDFMKKYSGAVDVWLAESRDLIHNVSPESTRQAQKIYISAHDREQSTTAKIVINLLLLKSIQKAS